MSYTVAELTTGLDVLIAGDSQCQITGVATLKNAEFGQLSFLSNAKYKKYLGCTKASAVVLSPQYADLCSTNAIITDNPYLIYAKIARFFMPDAKPSLAIDKTVIIGKNCKIAHDASIAAYVVIGDNVNIGSEVCIGAGSIIGNNCIIGDKSRLDCRVTIYDNVLIGARAEILSGTVIGSDGFGFANDKGIWYKVPQLGRVVIADDVSIGSNCTIDRGAIEDTYIATGVKLDNLVQVGHNVNIGQHTIVAGCVGISGSVTIGKYCLIGGGVGIGGHLTIADRVTITGMTAVTKSILNSGVYSSGVGGVVTNSAWRRYSARVHKLDTLVNRVSLLEKNLLNK